MTNDFTEKEKDELLQEIQITMNWLLENENWEITSVLNETKKNLQNNNSVI